MVSKGVRPQWRHIGVAEEACSVAGPGQPAERGQPSADHECGTLSPARPLVGMDSRRPPAHVPTHTLCDPAPEKCGVSRRLRRIVPRRNGRRPETARLRCPPPFRGGGRYHCPARVVHTTFVYPCRRAAVAAVVGHDLCSLGLVQSASGCLSSDRRRLAPRTWSPRSASSRGLTGRDEPMRGLWPLLARSGITHTLVR